MPEAVPKFELREASPSCAILKCQGDLSWDDRDLLVDAVEQFLGTHGTARSVAIDLTSVQFINSAGIGALFQVLRKVRDREGRVALANLTPLMERIFEAVGLNRLTTVTDTVDEAVRQLTPHELPTPSAPPA